MAPRKKNSQAPHAAAAAADFDWDAGRDYRPSQIGHQYACDLPFDEEELDTIAAARCWIDYALCDCWAPLLLCSPKRSLITQERPSNEGADRLRHWWEEEFETECPTVYAPPNPPDELRDLCLSREPPDDFFAPYYNVIKSIDDYSMCDDDGDFPDDDGIYRPSIHTLRRGSFLPDLSQQVPEPLSPPAAPAAPLPLKRKLSERSQNFAAPSRPSVPRSSLLDRFMCAASGFEPRVSSRQKVRLPLGQRRTTGRGRFLGIDDTVRPPHTGVLTCTGIQFS